MSDAISPEIKAKPNIYFIGDSATMREVVKIAFRRENFNVVTCPDMVTAVAQFDETAPQAVISDVMMPDKDGYQLCDYIKQHPRFGRTPVFLMSGVVNKEMTERAQQVKADELIRKPIHPQDLVVRVKRLLNHAEADLPSPPSPSVEANLLSCVFGTPAAPIFPTPPPPPAFAPPRMPQAVKPAVAAPSQNGAELQKLQLEVKRLEALVKKLQKELASEREYCATLESQLETTSAVK